MIVGEVDPDVERIGIRDSLGTSYVQVGDMGDPGFFSSYVYGNSGDVVVLVAFGPPFDMELDSVELRFP